MDEASWLEEIRKIARDVRSQVDERYAAALGRGADILIQEIFPLLGAMMEALTREGISVSVETRMGRPEGGRAGDALGAFPGGTVSTRLPNGELGPTLTVALGIKKTSEGEPVPRVIMRVGNTENDVYSQDAERVTRDARRVILAFVEQAAQADRQSGIERRMQDRISRNFPREQ